MEMKVLFSGIRERYPCAAFCIWQVRAISSFMHHISGIDVLIM